MTVHLQLRPTRAQIAYSVPAPLSQTSYAYPISGLFLSCKQSCDLFSFCYSPYDFTLHPSSLPHSTSSVLRRVREEGKPSLDKEEKKGEKEHVFQADYSTTSFSFFHAAFCSFSTLSFSPALTASSRAYGSSLHILILIVFLYSSSFTPSLSLIPLP